MTPARQSPGRPRPVVSDEVYLRRQRLLHLETRGRRTGRPHRVDLWFASGPGRIYLMAYARRHGRGTDWYQNLQHTSIAQIEAGERRYEGRGEPIADAAATLEHITALFIEKYGRQMVNSYYTETKRYPVCLAITPVPAEQSTTRPNRRGRV